MIVDKNCKAYSINSKFPNGNFTDNENVYIVDETTQEGKALKEKIIKNYPFFDFVEDTEGNLIDISIYPEIEYSIDKTQITTTETATITINDPAIITAIIDGQEYEVTDGMIEYSNENVGTHEIVLKALGYKDAKITIEVI